MRRYWLWPEQQCRRRMLSRKDVREARRAYGEYWLVQIKLWNWYFGSLSNQVVDDLGQRFGLWSVTWTSPTKQCTTTRVIGRLIMFTLQQRSVPNSAGGGKRWTFSSLDYWKLGHDLLNSPFSSSWSPDCSLRRTAALWVSMPGSTFDLKLWRAYMAN